MNNNTTTIKGLEQGRAKFAYECANQVPKELKESYRSHVKSFPMLVKTNGLGSALAFLFSKRDKEQGVYKRIGNDIVNWLKKDEKYKNYGLGKLSDLKSLTEGVIEIDSPEYRALTIEVLAFFSWLRRFADGLIEGEDENE